jgi:hypothetical protein
MRLRARTIQVGVLAGALGNGLVARRVAEAIRVLRFDGHVGFSVLALCSQLPLSFAVGLGLSFCAGRPAGRLRNGHACPVRLRRAAEPFSFVSPLPVGREAERLAFGSFASWIMDNSLGSGADAMPG